MPSNAKYGLNASVSNYSGKRIYTYCTSQNPNNTGICSQQFITGVPAPDNAPGNAPGTCGCGTPCCSGGQHCLNDLGVEAYNPSCVVNGVPEIVYRLNFGYCIGNSTTQPYQSPNSIAQATLQWYYQLPSSYTYIFYDSIGSTGYPDYGSSCTVFQNPVHTFQNCYINYFSPGNVYMTEYTNCTNSSNPAYGVYSGGVPYC